jgi:predicted nuclease of predicted toxin-antitoxin system
MAYLHADENFRYTVVEQLRLLGHDVLTVREAGQPGGTDAQVLAFATQAGRAVLTFDRRDFVRLHAQTAAHGGIVVCTDDDAVALAVRIHVAITAVPTLANQLLRVNRPP